MKTRPLSQRRAAKEDLSSTSLALGPQASRNQLRWACFIRFFWVLGVCTVFLSLLCGQLLRWWCFLFFRWVWPPEDHNGLVVPLPAGLGKHMWSWEIHHFPALLSLWGLAWGRALLSCVVLCKGHGALALPAGAFLAFFPGLALGRIMVYFFPLAPALGVSLFSCSSFGGRPCEVKKCMLSGVSCAGCLWKAMLPLVFPSRAHLGKRIVFSGFLRRSGRGHTKGEVLLAFGFDFASGGFGFYCCSLGGWICENYALICFFGDLVGGGWMVFPCFPWWPWQGGVGKLMLFPRFLWGLALVSFPSGSCLALSFLWEVALGRPCI